MYNYWHYVSTAIVATLLIAYFFILPAISNNRLEVLRPVISTVVQAVYATGTVEGEVNFELRPKQSARLIQLLADEGSMVENGYLLAQLEDIEQQARISEIQAQADYQKANFERQQTLFKTRSVSKEALDRAKAEYETSLAALKAAEAVSLNYKILSPDNCKVIKRDGEIGQLITPEHIIFWLMCGGKKRITAEVDEEDIVQIKPGQKVILRADAFPDKTFETTVTSITPRGDPIARSFRVRIALPEDSPFMIGMTVENNIIIREAEQGKLVPASAVSNGAVFVVEEGKLVKRAVKIGARTATEIEIIEGIDSDSLVLRNFSEGFLGRERVRYKTVQ